MTLDDLAVWDGMNLAVALVTAMQDDDTTTAWPILRDADRFQRVGAITFLAMLAAAWVPPEELQRIALDVAATNPNNQHKGNT